ncbi:MAG: hypothetical protein Q7S86_03130 [bacterium]|nr:hypothetical protein [bacterium]
MTKKILIPIVIIVAGATLVAVVSSVFKNTAELPIEDTGPVMCTMDAKMCPDGSAVGRQGPKCEFAKCPDVATTQDVVPVTDELVLGVGQMGKVGGLSITLDSIAQDSRCPTDVQCVWAGLVEVKVKLADVSKSETVNISSGRNPHLFGGYEVSVVAVTPTSQSTKKIGTDEYRVTFRITK